MATIIRKETRKRGFFGWVFLILFIGFNLFMLLWVVSGASAVSEVEVGSKLESDARAVGGVIGMGIILFIWACGAVVLGLFTLLSRGKKIIVEETVA